MKQTHNQQLWGIVLAAGEGTRVRDFLGQRCGGRGIKQFCTVVGRRSLLEHTLARVERLIPPQRILIVVSPGHRDEVAQQLAHWPADNVIFQPANRETAPGILLPLAHLSHRDPGATVAVFPSDHFILEEERFMAWVRRAVAETQRFPQELTLLGMTPERAEEGYGWIEPAGAEEGRETQAVRRFWEKPALAQAHALLRRGALWNTFVCVAQAPTLWDLTWRAAPDLYRAFRIIRRALGGSQAPRVTEHVYERCGRLTSPQGCASPWYPGCGCCRCQRWAGVTGGVRSASVPRWSCWATAKRAWPGLGTAGARRLLLFPRWSTTDLE